MDFLIAVIVMLVALGADNLPFLTLTLMAGACYVLYRLKRTEARLQQAEKSLQALRADFEKNAAPPMPMTVVATPATSLPITPPSSHVFDSAPTLTPAAQERAAPVMAATLTQPIVEPDASAPPSIDIDLTSSPISHPTPAPSPQPALRLEPDEASPGVVSSLGASLRAWVTGGNTIVRIAVMLLIVGVVFILRYAAERGLVPIEFRLAGVALGGLALFGVGWRLRFKRRGYGLTLQGAGIAIIYLTLFAALRLYQLIPAGLAFALLAALAALTVLLSVAQNALPLAAIAFTGAFLAPVLTSTGHGSHVALLSYYLVLNVAIAVIAHQKTWKLLNLLGFFFTFGISLAWGLKNWNPSLFWSTEPFLVVHVLLYLWITIQYSRQLIQQRAALSSDTQGSVHLSYVDGGLLFGMPIVAMGMQAAMVAHWNYALAISAAVMSGVYLMLGRWLWQSGGPTLRLMTEGLLGLGLVFLAMVTPLALDAQWTSIAWAIQGAGVVWMATRQQRGASTFAGVILLIGAVLAWMQDFDRYGYSDAFMGHGIAFLNLRFLPVAILLLCLFFAARTLVFSASKERNETPHENASSKRGLQALWDPSLLNAAHYVLLFTGALFLVVRGYFDFDKLFDGWQFRFDLQLALWLMATSLLAPLLQRRLNWRQWSFPWQPLMVLALLVNVASLIWGTDYLSGHWFSTFLTVAVLLAAGGAWMVSHLQRQATDAQRSSFLMTASTVTWGWYLLIACAFLSAQVVSLSIREDQGWSSAVWVTTPTLIAWLLLSALQSHRWPVRAHTALWAKAVLWPWALVCLYWILVTNVQADGGMAPLPYLPLLNPLDIAHAFLFLFIWRLWQIAPVASWAQQRLHTMVAGAALFWWFNGMLIRTLHHWLGTPMWMDGAWESGTVQTSLTICWTITALITMFLSTRRTVLNSARTQWVVGAVLLGVTVIKLLMVDMSQTSTLQRIVSFIGVGLLMLVIGYVSPLPPAQPEKSSETP